MFQGEFNIWTALLIFLCYSILDVFSSCFIIELSRLKKGTTTALTFLLYMGSGIGIYQYTHTLVYLLFAASGASLGNFILVTVEKKRQEKKNN